MILCLEEKLTKFSKNMKSSKNDTDWGMEEKMRGKNMNKRELKTITNEEHLRLARTPSISMVRVFFVVFFLKKFFEKSNRCMLFFEGCAIIIKILPQEQFLWQYATISFGKNSLIKR